MPFTATPPYNSAQENYLQRSDKRYTAGAFAEFEVSSALTLYGDFMYMHDNTRAQIAPARIISNRTYTINCDNPLLSTAQATALCGANAGSATANWRGTIAKRLIVEDRQRYYDITHEDYRANIGFKGDIGGGWSYDVYGQYGRVDYTNIGTNDASASRIQDSLLVRNVGGTPTCISGNAGCAPLDIFQLNQISPTAANYVFADGRIVGSATQRVASATVNGDLSSIGGTSPWSTKPVSIAAGFEYREDKLSLTPSANVSSNDLTGFGGQQATRGSTNVKEGFFEVLAPIVTERPFFHELSVDLAYRRSDYNLAGGLDTYKASAIFVPSRDISFRGGYNRAARAPNVVELFAAQTLGTASLTDSCAGTTPAATQAQCANTGVTAAQYGRVAPCASNFCTTLTGGNLALKPEEADTYTIGVVLTPRSIRSFSLSVDYYNIKVNGPIGTVPVALAFTNCLNKADPFFCSFGGMRTAASRQRRATSSTPT